MASRSTNATPTPVSNAFYSPNGSSRPPLLVSRTQSEGRPSTTTPDGLGHSSSTGVLVNVDIVKGSSGFGFTLAETRQGQIIKQISDSLKSHNIAAGDVLVAVNGVRVSRWSHDDVVNVLRSCDRGCVTRLTLLTSRSASHVGNDVIKYSRQSSASNRASPAANDYVDFPNRKKDENPFPVENASDQVLQNGDRTEWQPDLTALRRDFVQTYQQINSLVLSPDFNEKPNEAKPAYDARNNRIHPSQNSNSLNNDGHPTRPADKFSTSSSANGHETAESLLRPRYVTRADAAKRSTADRPTTSRPEGTRSSLGDPYGSLQRQRHARGVRNPFKGFVRRSLGTPRSLPHLPPEAENGGSMNRSPSLTSLSNFSGTPDFIPAWVYDKHHATERELRLDTRQPHHEGSHDPFLSPATSSRAGSSLSHDESYHSKETARSSTSGSSGRPTAADLGPRSTAAGLHDSLPLGSDGCRSGSSQEAEDNSLRPVVPGGREACNGYNARTAVIYSVASPAHYVRNRQKQFRSNSALAEQIESASPPQASPSRTGRASVGYDGVIGNRPFHTKDVSSLQTGSLDRRLLKSPTSRLHQPRTSLQNTTQVETANSVLTSAQKKVDDVEPEVDQATSPFYEVELHRGSRGFGFSIRGGKEFGGMPIYVLNIANGGPAYMDGRLRSEDQLIAINGVVTDDMTHSHAAELIQDSTSPLHLLVKRIAAATPRRVRTPGRVAAVASQGQTSTPPVFRRTAVSSTSPSPAGRPA